MRVNCPFRYDKDEQCSFPGPWMASKCRPGQYKVQACQRAASDLRQQRHGQAPPSYSMYGEDRRTGPKDLRGPQPVTRILGILRYNEDDRRMSTGRRSYD